MAAASLFMPSMGIWKPSPKRFKPAPKVIKRRQRTKSPINPEDITQRFKMEKELESLQEKHIRQKIRDYLKPFRYFLGAIGRFPYTQNEDLEGRKSLISAIKKTSCAPILEMGGIQENGLCNTTPDCCEDRPLFTYNPKSIKGKQIILYSFLGKVV